MREIQSHSTEEEVCMGNPSFNINRLKCIKNICTQYIFDTNDKRFNRLKCNH